MRKWLLVLSVLAASAWGQTVAIRAGNLIDPATGRVAKNQIILVKDKKIVEVSANVEIPKDSTVVDLSNEWVMPGIMDAHTHVTQSVKYFRELDHNYLVEATGLRALRGLHTAQILLNAGITTVRDVGNDANFAAVDLRKAIDAGWFVVPRCKPRARSSRRMEARAGASRRRLAHSGGSNTTTRIVLRRFGRQSAKIFSTALI
jgi:imidazolonepropionase-like amidohydrolase